MSMFGELKQAEPVDPASISPEESQAWDEAYENFQTVCRQYEALIAAEIDLSRREALERLYAGWREDHK